MPYDVTYSSLCSLWGDLLLLNNLDRRKALKSFVPRALYTLNTHAAVAGNTLTIYTAILGGKHRSRMFQQFLLAHKIPFERTLVAGTPAHEYVIAFS